MDTSPQRKPFLGLSGMELTLIAVLSCLVCAVVGLLGRGFLLNMLAESSASPTQRARPDYHQMLTDNGFEYMDKDSDGNRMYISNCGCIATLTPDAMKFKLYVTDDLCPSQDLGAILSIMYPSNVLDFVVNNMHEVVSLDKVVNETVSGYAISMGFDRTGNKLLLEIKDK